jgi:hypothetical protein
MLDEIRRDETRELRAAGYEPVLRKARWCLLKRPENLTDRQTTSQATFAELGMNGKAKLTMKKAYGFKSFNVAEVALLHTLGKLPTPEVAHRFW